MGFFGACSFRNVTPVLVPKIAPYERTGYYLTSCEVPTILTFADKRMIANTFDEDEFDTCKSATRSGSCAAPCFYTGTPPPMTKLVKSFSRRQL